MVPSPSCLLINILSAVCKSKNNVRCDGVILSNNSGRIRAERLMFTSCCWCFSDSWECVTLLLKNFSIILKVVVFFA